MSFLELLKGHVERATLWLLNAISFRRRDIFDYEFSGISVWLEPDESDARAVSAAMASLAEKCGGPSHGLHDFAPHCTMLYNMPRNAFLEKKGDTMETEDQGPEVLLRQSSQEMLNQVVEDYKKTFGEEKRLMMNPTSLQLFPFPPFACVITFLQLEQNNELDNIHQILKKTFPPDERHQSSGKLMPHISLVYAPEATENLLYNETKRLSDDDNTPSLLAPMRAKYLSVWNTQGRISDWKRIAQIELP